MKLAMLERDGASRLAVLEGDLIIDLFAAATADDRPYFRDTYSYIEGGEAAATRARALRDQLRERAEREGNAALIGAGLALAPGEAHFLPPLLRPRKNVFCVGWNYLKHFEERSKAMHQVHDLPEVPVFFSKAPTSVIGPDAAIDYDARLFSQLDWEVELAIVIGSPGKNIPKERAFDHIFGYTIVNDVSPRDVQYKHVQWFKGKSLDTMCPMGPCIADQESIPDPQNLDIRLRVNGVQKQNSNTHYQYFDVPTVVSILSQGITLEAGDVIATGTPEGVGNGRTPKEFLMPGDVVEAEIEGIGILRNPVRAV